jgi:hypothetical protein
MPGSNGAGEFEWTAAVGQLAILFGDRFEPSAS